MRGEASAVSTKALGSSPEVLFSLTKWDIIDYVQYASSTSTGLQQFVLLKRLFFPRGGLTLRPQLSWVGGSLAHPVGDP